MMRDDLDKLQGSWNVTALEVDGQTAPSAMLADATITVKGNRFRTTGMGAEYTGTVRIDPVARPREIDLKFTAGPERGATNPGIYKIAGETWTLCLATRGQVRPSKFATKPGTGIALETLNRATAGAPAARPAKLTKKPVPSKAASGPATELDGEWRLVSGVINGSVMEKSVVQWVRRVTGGGRTTVYAGPNVMLAVDFKCDPARSPKNIDYLVTAGPQKGKTQLGIYELKKDLLTFCVAAPGSGRPKEFQSKPRDGRTMTVWKRA